MEKSLFEVVNLLAIIAVASIPFIKARAGGILTRIIITLQTGIISALVLPVFTGGPVEFTYPGSWITGPVPVRLDSLSAWFILIIGFIYLTGTWYGVHYMNNYSERHNSLKLHNAAFLLLYISLIDLCLIQNGLVFLIIWELMALSSFIAVIFEHDKPATLKAGINYLIQSHVSVVLLTLGFLWAAIKSGSYDFNTISAYCSSQPVVETRHALSLLILFLIFFAGFAFKAGFVPFHTWLPYAHPAAPAPVSGIMSGVLIKIGIFGILRMLLIIRPDFTTVGYFIAGISIVSGLYGVMLAIVQHDLKKLLAYHSVENIGIIGLGIGIGCIGLGMDNMLIATLGFAGALLHTLNHALFKSLLFYTAGIVYQATHTLNIEHLGGLIKKMPQTAVLFLIAAIAISGIPPFNGFISEFIIYNGLYQWLQDAPTASLIGALLLILGLVLIGGLALLCFTKAFSIVFLGNPRKEFNNEIKEAPFSQLLPLYFIAFLILFIGIYPQLFLNLLIEPVNLFTGIQGVGVQPFSGKAFQALQPLSFAMLGLLLLIILVYTIKKLALKNRNVEYGSTWGCGYVGPADKQQYTASSFVRTYTKLNSATLLFERHEKGIKGIFPEEAHFESHARDKIEKWLVQKPVKLIRTFLGRFLFLQNGRLQAYILYGILFILALIFIPMIYDKIMVFIGFLKHL